MKRIIQLDILRALAIIMVMLAHLNLGRERNVGIHDFMERIQSSPHDWAHVSDCILRSIIQSGWMGVDLFFVLSGFLVSGLLFREYEGTGAIKLKRFLVRRGFKIYPGFYVLLGTTLLVFALTKVRTATPAQICSEAFFVTNYGPNIWGHTWSLAVEEHFYLLLGLLLLILSRRGGRNPFASVPKIFLAVAASELALRVATTLVFPEFEYKIHAFPTHLRLDSLFFGSLLAYYSVFDPRKLAWIKRARMPALTASLLMISTPFFRGQDDPWMRTLGFTGLYLGFGGLIMLSLTVTLPRSGWYMLPIRALAYLGIYSYSIYLWHIPVVAVGVGFLSKMTDGKMNVWGEILVFVVGSLVAGVMTAKIVEFPALHLRDRFFPSDRSGQS